MRPIHPLATAIARTYGPAELKELIGIFDAVWASLLAEGLGRNGRAAGQRERLAIMILELAHDGQLGALEITRTAGRLMRDREQLKA